MVSWLVADGQHAGDYVAARENLKKSGDRDYINVSGSCFSCSSEGGIMFIWLRFTGYACFSQAPCLINNRPINYNIIVFLNHSHIIMQMVMLQLYMDENKCR